MDAPHVEKARHGGYYIRVSDYELEALLLSKVSAHMTWSEWTEQRQTQKLPALQHRLLALQSSLFTEFGEPSQRLRCCSGAYFPLIRLIQRLICSELERSKIAWPNSRVLSLTMKVSIDGRKLRGNPNVGWCVSFVESADNQSNTGHYTFATGDMREPELAGHGIWAEIGLDEALALLRAGPILLGPLCVLIDPFVCADWKCLTYFCGFSPANSGDTACICGWCGVDKAFLNAGWLRQYAFLAHPVALHLPVRETPSLPIWRVRYCAMHGCNRLLDNHLRVIQSLGYKGELKDIVRQVCPQWGKVIALHPLQMKAFHQQNLGKRIADLFVGTQRQVTLPQREAPAIQISIADAVHRLMDACKGYKHFAYTEYPVEADFAALSAARDNILAVDYALQAQLQPTTHYMTTHFVDFANQDRSAYHTVQEGAEHHHKDDRLDAWMAFTNDEGRWDERSKMQMMLDTQELKRILIRRSGRG